MNDFVEVNYEEKDYSLLWSADGKIINHQILTEFPIDQDVKKISIFVSGLEKKPDVEVFGPQKQKATVSKTQDSNQSIKQIFDHPEPVQLEGRPGHQGYFPYRGVLIPGDKVKFNSDLSTIKLSSSKTRNIKSSEISLVSLGGKTLTTGAVNSDFKIPVEPFRTVITWTDNEGYSGQRMSQKIFEPYKLPLVSFNMISNQPTSQEFCDLINSSTHWSLLENLKTGASAIVSCIFTDDIKELKLKAYISLVIPWDTNKKLTTVFLSSPDFVYLKKEDCLNAENIFSKFPKTIKNKEKLSATHSFSCIGGPTKFQATLGIKISQSD